MTTPWGDPLATFDNRDAFYAAYPQLAVGWPLDKPPHDAPLGVDVDNQKDYLVTLCTPSQKAGDHPQGDITGVATAWDFKTERVHVLAENITHADAERRFKRPRPV